MCAAFRSGAVMGFLLAGNGLLLLFLTIYILKAVSCTLLLERSNTCSLTLYCLEAKKLLQSAGT